MINIKRNFGFIFAFALCALAGLYSCNRPDTTDADASNQEFCIPDSLLKNLSFDTIRMETVTSELSLSGKITVNEDDVERIFPVVSGHVADVKVTLGDYVQKGQLLATIRSADMANYYNEFKSSQSELAIAKKNLEVTEDMRKSGLSSEKDYITAQNDYEKALAEYNKISEVLKIYGSTIEKNDSAGSGYSIKSPMSGFIVEKNINPGMEIRPDQTNELFTVSDLKEVWAVANVYETDISKIQPGNDAVISTLSYPDKKFSGKVERISNILNPETNVMTVKINLSNPDYILKPGMFANISVLFPGKDKMLTVPSKAIVFDDNKSYLVLYRKRCDVDMEKVSVIKSSNDKSYLQDDSLHEGDLVVERNGLFVFTALKKL